MAFLRNRNAPASAEGGLTWPTPELVVEVADRLANDLLRIKDGGFHEVLPSDPAHPAYIAPDLAAQADLAAEKARAAAIAKAAPAKTPIAE